MLFWALLASGQINMREVDSSWLEIPCRRAVADASRGAEKLSSNIRSFHCYPGGDGNDICDLGRAYPYWK